MSVWACSDLHGQRWAFDQILETIGPEDKVYFLGDAIDRGPDGWQIMRDIMNDPRFIYIMGNHESMMVDALLRFPHDPETLEQWYWNGGKVTHKALRADPEWYEVLQKVAQFPDYLEYINPDGIRVRMSHAGFTPDEEDWHGWGDDLIWDRNHFLHDNWNEERNGNDLIVHGHTPIPYILEERTMIARMTGRNLDSISQNEEIEPGAYWYCGNHKVDIDCGVHYTGITTLLNLDSFDEQVFISKEARSAMDEEDE